MLEHNQNFEKNINQSILSMCLCMECIKFHTVLIFAIFKVERDKNGTVEIVFLTLCTLIIFLTLKIDTHKN